MKKIDVRNELYAKLRELLIEATQIPVYSEIADYNNNSWLLINAYNSVDGGTKTRWASRISWVIECYTKKQGLVEIQEIVNKVVGAINSKKGSILALENFSFILTNEPTITSFTEKTENGLVNRVQLRYVAEISQNF